MHSGHGVHLYWLPNEPLVISDAGDPAPVETEWSLTADGRKKPRRFIFDGEDRIDLDQRRHVSKISPQAQRIQDIQAGISHELGGDHTTDLTRLRRLPGTLNRKDERNGKIRVRTRLSLSRLNSRVREFQVEWRTVAKVVWILEVTNVSIDLSSLKDLPVADKLRIVTELWNNIAASNEPLVVPDEILTESSRRSAELKSDPTIAIDEKELWRRIEG